MSKKNGNKPAPKISTDMSGIAQAIKNSKAPSIIHHRGDLNTVTFDGKKFNRREYIFMKDYGMVKCAPYDDHFLMYDASRKGWTTWCTCGSFAVITGYDVYKRDASPQGLLMLCMQHAQTGKHAPVNK